MPLTTTLAVPLTSAELHRLATLVDQRIDLGSVLGLDIDLSTLRLIRRLVDSERARRGEDRC